MNGKTVSIPQKMHGGKLRFFSDNDRREKQLWRTERELEPSMLYISFLFRKIQVMFSSTDRQLSLGIADFLTSHRFRASSPCQTSVSRGTLYSSLHSQRIETWLSVLRYHSVPKTDRLYSSLHSQRIETLSSRKVGRHRSAQLYSSLHSQRIETVVI
jgi:hypothetical protein